MNVSAGIRLRYVGVDGDNNNLQAVVAMHVVPLCMHTCGSVKHMLLRP